MREAQFVTIGIPTI